jgi:hypothetical protein
MKTLIYVKFSPLRENHTTNWICISDDGKGEWCSLSPSSSF